MANVIECLQNKEKEMLIEVAKVFYANNIRFFAACGTCLGAIRHKGFIPWDDDVDIYIMGVDLDKAASLFKNHRTLEWHDNKTKQNYPFSFPKIVAKGTILVEKGEEQSRYQGGVYIDVFPLISTSRSKIKLWFSEKVRYLRYAVIRLSFMNFESKKRRLLGRLTKLFLKPVLIQKKLFENYKKHKTGGKYLIDSGTFGKQARLLKESFDSFDLVLFDNISIPVPVGFDRYLTDYYGDYMKMPPLEKRISNHKFLYLEIDGVVLK